MTIEKQFASLAAYNDWANRRVFMAVAHLRDEDRKRDVGLFFKSLHGTLNHILLADRIWLGRITGRDQRGPMDRILYEDFSELVAARLSEDRRLNAFVEGLEADDLDRAISYRNTAGQGFEMSLGDILMHVFNHQTHHRGQAHAGLSIVTRREPDSLDLLQFHRGAGSPAASALVKRAET